MVASRSCGDKGRSAGIFAAGVGGPDDLAHAQPAAGDQGGLRVGPVVAADQARGVRQARGPAELAGRHDQDLPVEPRAYTSSISAERAWSMNGAR